MTKHVIEFVAKRVVHETDAAISDVVARLNEELNKERAGPEVFRSLAAVRSRSDVEQAVRRITEGKDFMLFQIFPHHNWMNAYLETSNTPETYVYILGNPLIAQAMMRHDLVAGLQIPPRILVVENEDRAGTKVIYDVPSSMIAVAGPGEVVNDDIRHAAEELDDKLEALVVKVTAV